MTIRTLYFATYRDIAGTDQLDVELAGQPRVHDLVAALRERGGAWTRLPAQPVVAVNMEYASLSTQLREGDEVAFIPPVSGG